MTILAVAQQVALAVGISYPLSVFSSTDRDWQEMQAIANEAARAIMDAHDWQGLLRVHTMTGDGGSEAFDLPPTYGRMLASASLWSSRYRDHTTQIVNPDDWLELDVRPVGAVLGLWCLFGGQMHVRPIMSAGETAKFFFIRNDVVSGGKDRFTLDTDTFALDERLLKLCMTYLWKQAKGQDFTAELSDYEMALMKAKDRDSGSKPVLSGNVASRTVGRASNVWPGTVGGVR